MPHARRSLTQRSARVVCESSFTGSDDELFGIEAEWPVHRSDDVGARPTAAVMDDVAGPARLHGSRVTFEPGGQVEVSTAPAASIGEALVALTEDAAHVHAALAAAGYSCSDRAVDGRRPPRRVLDKARYEAMEAYFAVGGTSGAWMMSNTASTQVNLSHDPADADRRWLTLNQVAPVLVAAFANSPGTDEQGREWASLRQAIWWATDPGRTRPVRLDVPPCTAWLQYALDADVAFVGDGPSGDTGVGLLPGFPFARWLREGHELGWPTEDDLRYHLTMLFPPVRPRGWLELRVLDALPPWIRTVACLVVATVGTASAATDLCATLPDTAGLWPAATRDGVRDPRLGRAADALFAVVQRDLGSVTRDAGHEAMLDEFVDRFVRRRRMPGDEYAEPVDLRTTARPNAFA